VHDNEIVYADGGFIPIQKLRPFMGGRWRIKARLTKKGEKRNYKNAKGEGSLLNIELMDEEGT
jgi:replication factor A1